MIIFLDTEFTDLVIEPQLLSVAIVAESAPSGEFYAEVTDRRRIHAASWFALDVVLPQFGKIAHAPCSYATLGARLCAYMDRLISTSGRRECIEIAFSYDLDWELTKRAMRDGGDPTGALARNFVARNVDDIVGSGAGKRAAESYFSGQSEAPISRHHALCDARALRVAYQAAQTSTDATEPPPARSASSRSAIANSAP